MTRRRRLLSGWPFCIASACGAAWAAGPASSAAGRPADPPASGGALRIVVFHTNDIHGWILPRPAPRGRKDAGGPPRGLPKSVGGVVALAEILRGETGPKLFLDAGDWFQGTPEGTLSRGEAMVESFNALGYDAVAVGNHDYDLGEARLRELVREMGPPVLGANVYDRGSGARVKYLKPYVVKEVAGVRFGIFGLLTTHMRELELPDNVSGLTFRREAEEAEDMVRELKAQGATVIVAVTHMGYEDPKAAPYEGDRYLAAHVPGIDLIVGGHTHTAIEAPDHDPANGTLIVQAGSYLTHVGKVTLEIDPATRRVVRSRGELIGLAAGEAAGAPDVSRIVSKYKEEIGRALEVVVGTATDTLTRNRAGESSLGDWMADCARSWSGTELAFQNGGGIRSDLPAGPVTLRELFEIMPFDNYVVKFKLTGRQVRENLERGVSGAPGVIQVSGLRFSYDPDAPAGSRVTSVTVGDRPLEDHWVYSSATIDFLFKGGDGYTFSQAADAAETGTLMRDVLAWCARGRSPIRTVPAERIVRQPAGAGLGAGRRRGEER